MRALFARFDVDFDQWKALTRVALKLDFRTSSLGQGQMRAVRTTALLVGQALVYLVFGAFLAVLVWISDDLFLVGTMIMTYVVFMVGTAVLIDHNSAVTSPLDYPILGFRPISSRTYFASRLTNVLVYTTAVTTLVALLPALSLLRHGLAVGLAGVVAIYACATSTTLVILLGYASLIRVVGPRALKRALSYVQLIFSFFIYGGYMMLSGDFARRMLDAAAFEKTPWLLLYPGTWFASFLDIAAGRTGAMELIPAALAIVAMAVMAAMLGGRLSLEYSEHLGAVTAVSERARPPSRSRGGWWFRTGEARAAALLIRSQFRNDMRFRMSVLGILPLTLLYLWMGARDGQIHDPFERTAGQGFALVSMAVMMFPSILKVSLTYSESFRASWLFFACPVDRTRMIRAAKNVLAVSFLLPYLVFVAAVQIYFIPNVWHVAVHTALLGLLSHLCLQFFVLWDPALPFSKPAQRTRGSGVFMLFMFVMILVASLMNAFSAFLYARASRAAIAFGVVLLASAAVDWLTRARVEHQARSLEFQG